MIGRLLAGVAVAALVFSYSSTGASAAVPPQASSAVPVCPGPAAAGSARCHAWVVVSARGTSTSVTPAGYGPVDLVSAYNLGTATGSGLVAIVDAYDDPNAESDLGVYRTQYGLTACTSTNGCFKKVNQNGVVGGYPRANSGWALEISLDLDMVSAICPNCHILLVEATTNSFANLGAAENEAATLGAQFISNSWGGSESSSELSYDSYFSHAGVQITVSSGDNGYGVEYPASSPYVTAVGGTTLNRASNATRGWTETAWSGAGSGCSAYEAQPSWQSSVTNITTNCKMRAVADVAFDADPNTGVAVYDSVSYQGRKGWQVVGGTSVGAPATAAVYALAGNATPVVLGYSYSNVTSLFDVASGSNGSCGSDLCNAVIGWDGPTGNGTPNGIGAY